MAVTHFKLEMSSDVSGGLYHLTNSHAHGDPRYILLGKKSCGSLPNAACIRMHQVWLPLPKAALHHSQQPLCPHTHALTAYLQKCDVRSSAFCKKTTWVSWGAAIRVSHTLPTEKDNEQKVVFLTRDHRETTWASEEIRDQDRRA